MSNYREVLTWPVRKAILLAARLVGLFPGTTYGEVVSMHDGPCGRCVGRAVVGPREEGKYIYEIVSWNSGEAQVGESITGAN